MNKQVGAHNAANVSIGKAVQAGRSQLQLSVKELSKHTNISERFIEKLETEQFANLPAKVYTLSLAEDLFEYLKFPAEQRVALVTQLETELNTVEAEKFSLLKNENFTPKFPEFLLEEDRHQRTGLKSPLDAAAPETHDEETVVVGTNGNRSRRGRGQASKFFTHLLWSSVALALLMGIAVLLWFFAFKPRGLALDTLGTQQYEKRMHVFALYGQSQTLELSEGDQLRIFFANTIVLLSLTEVTAETLSFTTTNGSKHHLNLHTKHFIDLDNDDTAELLMKYQKLSGELAVIFVENLLFGVVQVDYEQLWNTHKHVLVGKHYTLLENQAKLPITVYVHARSLPIHLSYNIDGRRQNTVNLSTGASVTITADEHLELQVGNYLSAALIINNIPINLHLEEYNRYSTTKIIKWLANYDNETLFDLVITDYIN